MPIKTATKSTAAAGRAAVGRGAAQAPADGQPVSLRPSDQVSEGLVDDIDVLFESMRFTLEGPPNYKAGDDKVPLFTRGRLIPQDEETDAFDHWWTAGDASRFQPSEDGTYAVRVKGTGGLGNSTNSALLFTSIVNAGFPEDKITPQLTCFDGMVAHVKRLAQPKRSGLPQQEGAQQRTYLAVEKIIRLPWEAAPKGKAAVKGAAAPSVAAPSKTAAATSPSNGDPSELVLEVIDAILAKGSPAPVDKLPAKAFGILAQPAYKPHRQEILNLLNDMDFLGAQVEAGRFTVDESGENLSPA